MGVEDGQLVAVVLGEPHLRVVELELEAVGRGRRVTAGDVSLGDPVAKEDQPTGLVRRFSLGVSSECLPHRGGHYHQTVRSIDASTSSASQKSAERYFQPPSASTPTTTPWSSSAASLRATCTTAPEETPAKMPSSSRRRRTPATDSAFDTSTFRSSLPRPITGSPGSGSAAATTTSGKLSRRRSPVPINVPPVPSPATRTSTRSSASAISAPVPS